MTKENLTKQELIALFKKQAKTGTLKILEYLDNEECYFEYLGFKFDGGYICIGGNNNFRYFITSGNLNFADMNNEEYTELYDLFIEKQYILMNKQKPAKQLFVEKIENINNKMTRPASCESMPKFLYHHVHTLQEVSDYFLPTVNLSNPNILL
jgi:hypothetical protein